MRHHRPRRSRPAEDRLAAPRAAGRRTKPAVASTPTALRHQPPAPALCRLGIVAALPARLPAGAALKGSPMWLVQPARLTQPARPAGAVLACATAEAGGRLEPAAACLASWGSSSARAADCTGGRFASLRGDRRRVPPRSPRAPNLSTGSTLADDELGGHEGPAPPVICGQPASRHLVRHGVAIASPTLGIRVVDFVRIGSTYTRGRGTLPGRGPHRTRSLAAASSEPSIHHDATHEPAVPPVRWNGFMARGPPGS